MDNLNISLTLFLIFICAAANGYLTNWLYLQRKTSHEGIFKSKTAKVIFLAESDGFEVEPEHSQMVALPDYIRRFFGAYSVSGDSWIVSKRAEVFTCKFCLSFWTTFIFSILIFFFCPALLLPVVHLATAGLSVCFAGLITYANHA